MNKILTEIRKLKTLKNELEKKKTLIHSDDVLYYLAHKTNPQTLQKFPFKYGWFENTEPLRDSENKKLVTSYKRAVKEQKKGIVGAELQFEYMSVDEYTKLTLNERTGWIPMYLEKLELSGNSEMVFSGNDIRLRLRKLNGNLNSRYMEAVKGMVKAVKSGVVKYERRTPAPKERNIIEAMRNQLVRYFRPVKYEYNLRIKDEEIAEMIMNGLKEIIQEKAYIKTAKPKIEKGTLYLKNPKQNSKETSVKVYSVTAIPEKREKYKKGDEIKIEITFDTKFFSNKRKKNELGGTVKDLRFQENIYIILREEIEKYLEKYIIKPLRVKGILNLLKSKMRVSSSIQVYDNLFSTDRVENNITKRLNKIDNRIDNLESRLEYMILENKREIEEIKRKLI